MIYLHSARLARPPNIFLDLAFADHSDHRLGHYGCRVPWRWRQNYATVQVVLLIHTLRQQFFVLILELLVH